MRWHGNAFLGWPFLTSFSSSNLNCELSPTYNASSDSASRRGKAWPIRLRKSVCMASMSSWRTRGWCASHVARNRLYVPVWVRWSYSTRGAFSSTRGACSEPTRWRFIFEFFWSQWFNIYSRLSNFETMSHGRRNQAYKDLIDRLEKVLIIYCLGLERRKIFSENNFCDLIRFEITVWWLI